MGLPLQQSARNYFRLLYGDRPAPDDLTALKYVAVKPCAALGDVVVHVLSRGCADALAERAAALESQGDLHAALGCRGAEADLLRCTDGAAAGPVTRIDPSLFELLLGGSPPANLAGLEWIAVRGDRQRGMLAEVDPLKCAKALTSRAAELRGQNDCSQAELSAAQRCADMAMEMVGPSAVEATHTRVIARAAMAERCMVLAKLLEDAEAELTALRAESDPSETCPAVVGESQLRKIFVETPSGGTRSFDVTEQDSVGSVEAKICELGLGSASDRLVLSSELESGRLLQDYNLADHDTLRLVPTMPITVNQPTGATFTVEAAAEDTVQRLRVMIRDAAGVPPDQQRVVYDGKPLEDGLRLRDYGIGGHAVVHLIREP